MLEVVFDSSTAGSLTVAMNHPPVAREAVGVILEPGDGKPSRLTAWLATRKAKKENARNWAQAVPLEGSRRDILCFPLALNVGEIDEAGIGPKREAALADLFRVLPKAEQKAQETLDTARESLSQLLERAKEEPIRIWASENPAEACGACFILDQLRPLNLEKLDITLVDLPRFEERPGGVLIEFSGWGDVAPHEMGRLAAGGRKLTPAVARLYANRWKELQKENAPLRAALNGKLVRVPETWYDPFLLRELDNQQEEFWEAKLIGGILGSYRLGVGDGWLHNRIEVLIRQGLLAPVTEPGEGDAAYRRTLRKAR